MSNVDDSEDRKGLGSKGSGNENVHRHDGAPAPEDRIALGSGSDDVMRRFLANASPEDVTDKEKFKNFLDDMAAAILKEDPDAVKDFWAEATADDVREAIALHMILEGTTPETSGSRSSTVRSRLKAILGISGCMLALAAIITAAVMISPLTFLLLPIIYAGLMATADPP